MGVVFDMHMIVNKLQVFGIADIQIAKYIFTLKSLCGKVENTCASALCVHCLYFQLQVVFV